jgi:hypothetical protein
LQRSSVRLLQPSDLLHDFQAGPDGAIGRVLLRMRKTEIHEDAITQVLRDISVVFSDRRHTGLAVLAQQTDQIFRIQFSPKYRRPHEVDEDHGELAALGRAGGLDGRLDLRRCNCGCGRCPAKLRRSGKEFTAVTERKT